MNRVMKRLEQKGVELKRRVKEFGAPYGNKNAAGPHRKHGGGVVRSVAIGRRVRVGVGKGLDGRTIYLNGKVTHVDRKRETLTVSFPPTYREPGGSSMTFPFSDVFRVLN